MQIRVEREKKEPKFPPTWRTMEVGDEKEGEEPIGLFLPPEKLWK
jgi:hypothetical protein